MDRYIVLGFFNLCAHVKDLNCPHTTRSCSGIRTYNLRTLRLLFWIYSLHVHVDLLYWWQLHNFTAVSGQFSCPKCTRLASFSLFYWHRVHNAPTLCRCAGKHFYGFRPFWCNVLDQSSWNLFLGVSHSNWHLRVQTCQSGQKLVSPNVITFDVNIDIELQTDEILWNVCKIKQKRQEKFKFITLNLITVEIRTWIRDFSWLFDINNHWLRIKT